ncbi:hypothetical protein O181_066947 [Austropuccinia psidii MF-1]|uniref:Uncharacterized protein n=1 Tax=Austropuccinia psidii MF-1 TaxID=1389203 RepID=A0A9Q3I4S4_9BASI|nr:hypothetical protein [Austropuccinia psidii MF-1]
MSKTTLKGLGKDGEKEEENSVEGEESEDTAAVPAPVGASEVIGGPTIAKSNQPVSHQSVPSLLVVMQHLTKIMENLKEA